MKRAIGAVILVMLVGGSLALRPYVFREPLALAVVGSGQGPTPYETQARIGIDLALPERGSRAGRFKIQTADVEGGLLASHFYSGTFRDFRAGPDRLKIEIAAVIDMNLDPWVLDALAGGGIPTLSVEATHSLPVIDGEERRGSRIFRVVPWADLLGAAAARWAKRSGAKRVFLLEETFDERSSAVADAFRRHAAVQGLDRVGEVRFHQPYDALPDEVMEARPDAVFMAGEPRPHLKAREIFTSLRERGYTGEIIFADADPATSLVVLAPVPFPETCRLVSLLAPAPADFTARFGYTPPGAWYGYVAAKAALDAIEKAESKDWRAIRRALSSLPAFDANGNAASPVLAGYTLKDGAWVFTETLK